MIIDKKVKIKGHSRNIKHYRSLGYDIKVGEYIEINPLHLTKGSSFKVSCMCSNCDSITNISFKDYYRSTKMVNPYLCKKCTFVKSNKTISDRYGVDNIMKSDIGKNRLKESLLTKYGVDHYSKTDEFRIKYRKTCVDRYKVSNVFSIPYIKQKIIRTNINKYGVQYPQQSAEILSKRLSTNLNKYGSKSPVNSYNNIIIKNNRMIDKYSEMIGDDYSIISYNSSIFNIRHNKLNCYFDIHIKVLLSRLNNDISLLCTICNKVDRHISSLEIELSNFIKSLDIDYINNDRTILGGKELDIYIPSKKLAIEFNGLYWHSELFKDRYYHLNKTSECIDRGIQLLHIWEDDWLYRRDIVKSIIKNKLNLIENKIYARKCDIKQVSSKMARIFLDDNHIQGFCRSKYKYGLYLDGELVSLMTFGYRYSNSKKEFELVRFCNKIDYNVVGGSSKLFKYFIKNHKYDNIISFADISMFSGNLYKILGFEYEHRSRCNYYWIVDGKRKHRYIYNKKKLVEQGFSSDMTEVSIMLSRGYYRIWGCGMDKYIYKY